MRGLGRMGRQGRMGRLGRMGMLGVAIFSKKGAIRKSYCT